MCIKQNRVSSFVFRLMLSVTFFVCLPAHANDEAWTESYRLEQVFQYDAAINALKAISSNSELVLLRRGWLNYQKGSHSSAINHYQKAIAKNPDSLDARLGVMLPLLSQQRWREAAKHANKVLAVAPWNIHAHLRLMKCEQQLKQWKELEKHASAVYKRYPSDASVLVFLARAQLKQGNSAAARKTYAKVLELYPDNFEAKQYVN